MPTIEEMTAWSIDDIVAELRGIKPADWTFELLDETTHLRAHIVGPDGTTLWWNTGADARTLLFDAYGWLWSRTAPKSKNPLWVPRDQRRLVPVHGGTAAPDPGDLDPTEVEAVYRDAHKH